MALTYFYAQVFGIIATALGLGLLLNRRTLIETIRELLDNRSALLVMALVTLFIGTIVLLTNNVWNEGLLPLVVTLIGWAFVIRAALILWLPHAALRRFFEGFGFEKNYYIFAGLALILGLYLAYNGFWG